ncbi:MAG TPA: type 4a pilus biogenesis protein PilO [Moraxellaceae bacterium]|nr:type 4a pilus biogenesis protein PilO [Moraxellaceae bacterium]
MKDATKKGFDLQEFIQTLNTLDPQNIGSWPVAVKIFIYLLVFVVVLVAGYALDLSNIRQNLAAGKETQVTLLGEFEQKVFKAQNLEVYKRQLKDMEDSFGALLRQLPQDTEVPGLLEDITHTGIGSGVDFDSIELGQESRKEFYAEQPINIRAHGDYHAFGAFVSGIAALPRIVTLHDFSITPRGNVTNDGSSPVLTLTIQAKTYRYSEATPSTGGKK